MRRENKLLSNDWLAISC